MSQHKPVRMKRKLRGADGGVHPHIKNIQAFTPVVKTIAQRLEMMRYSAAHFVVMLDIWGTDTEVQRAAKVAAERVIEEAGGE